jgi:uncharacterized protein YbjT (DUF2867 family)
VRVLLTGATGLIGSAIATRLLAEGHEVIGVGRRGGLPRPGMRWVALDMRNAGLPEHWRPHLAGIEAVINCAGVLQDSASDSTDAAHASGPAGLFAACEKAGVRRVIHLSAIGIDRETPTGFSRTKAKGDKAMMASGLDWVILRPSVVVGRGAYGGSALFRGLASLPIVPLVPDAGKLQIVQLDDLVATILWFLRPGAPGRVQLEVAGPDRLAFDDVVAAYRRWLGWQPARQVRVPNWLRSAMYRLGDLAGWLGWRPPIRTTAQQEILRGAVGDPAPWTSMTGIVPRSLEASFAAEPATVQEKWFARLYLLKPIVLGVFSLFWIATAFMSLGPGWEIGIGLMHEGGVTGIAAPLTVMAGALADLCIGIGIAFRRSARPALYAALVLSLAYVVIGTILVPRLWIDPLGPMLKIWPVLALNLVAIAILEDR